jgi:hypothetical protein
VQAGLRKRDGAGQCEKLTKQHVAARVVIVQFYTEAGVPVLEQFATRRAQQAMMGSRNRHIVPAEAMHAACQSRFASILQAAG